MYSCTRADAPLCSLRSIDFISYQLKEDVIKGDLSG